MGELVKAEDYGIISKEQMDQDAEMKKSIIEQMGAVTSYNSIKLTAKTSPAFESRKAEIGDFMLFEGLNDDDGINLGTTIPCMPLAFRALAIDSSNKDKTIRVFKADDPEYDRIKKASIAGKFGDGYMFGLEVLMLLAGAKNGEDVIATYYLSSKGARFESAKFMDKVSKNCELKSKMLESDYGKYAVPVLKDAANPITFTMPIEAVRSAIDTFRHPEREVDEAGEEAPADPNIGVGREV